MRAARTAGQTASFPSPARWAGDLAGPRRSRPMPAPMCGSMGDVSMQIPSPESRLTTDEYLRAAPDAYGDIEVVDGLVVHNVAQSEVHDLVVRRLAAALENARPAGGPCFRVSSDVAVRFADAASSLADHRLNIRYPDIMVRDCDPTTSTPYETHPAPGRGHIGGHLRGRHHRQARPVRGSRNPRLPRRTLRQGLGEDQRDRRVPARLVQDGMWSRTYTAARSSWTSRSA